MSITLVRKADIVSRAPARWKAAYSTGYFRTDAKKQAITAALDALSGANLTAERVNQIIGNTSWTENPCSECRADCDVLVRVGEEPDYEARWVDLCPDCLAAATAALGAA